VKKSQQTAERKPTMRVILFLRVFLAFRASRRQQRRGRVFVKPLSRLWNRSRYKSALEFINAHNELPRGRGAVIKQPFNPVRGLFFASMILLAALLPAPSFAQQESEQKKDQPQSQDSQQPLSQPAAPTSAPGKSPDSAHVQPGQTSAQAQEAKDKAADPSAAKKHDRLFMVLPNFLTVENESKVPPLTAGGKFKLVAKNSFDPAIFPFIGVIALIGQAENSDPEYGQGMEGYGKRYAAAFGDATIGSFMTSATFPALLHQDPRYYQMGHGGFRRRLFYSISRIFVTRSDSGSHQFNTSEIAGNLVAAGISINYHPEQERNVASTMTVWGTDTGWDALSNVLKEFWPDIRHKFSKKHSPESPAVPTN
jgi:hypothetical protein